MVIDMDVVRDVTVRFPYAFQFDQSQDGRLAVFINVADDATELWRRDDDGEHCLVRACGDENVLYPRLSPCEELVCFSRVGLRPGGVVLHIRTGISWSLSRGTDLNSQPVSVQTHT